VDLSSGALNPLGEARQTLWRPSQPSQQRLAGIANGRPVLALLDAHTLVSLVATRRCWAMDVDVSRDIVVAVCPEGDATAVSQYRLPAGSY
jgi:hypothetical protein